MVAHYKITHYIKAGVGIQSEVTAELMEEVKIDECEEYQKYVGVVFDEMKIKEVIIYDKHECIIKGFRTSKQHYYHSNSPSTLHHKWQKKCWFHGMRNIYSRAIYFDSEDVYRSTGTLTE